MEGKSSPQPIPSKLLPAPELYDTDRVGVKPLRLGERGIGMLKAAVPLLGLTWNFSSMPLMAPPPFGREIWGI